MAARLAGNLEATFNVLDGLLGDALGAHPVTHRVVAVMYGNKRKYDDLVSRVQGFEWSSGFYSPVGMLAFHMEMPSNEALLSMMLHETTHAYLDRYIARPCVQLPRWLNEGYAEYVGNSHIKKGELVPGKLRRTELYRVAGGAVFGSSGDRLSVDEVKKALRNGKAPTLTEIVSADREKFYSDEVRNLSCPMSWLLVHFLHHGGKDWARTRFPSLMLYVAEGYPASEVLTRFYGDGATLENEFREYVLNF